jgi:hypothetical protein
VSDEKPDLDRFSEDGFELWSHVAGHWVWRKVDPNHDVTHYRIARGSRYVDCAVSARFDCDPRALQEALRRMERRL